MAALADGTIVAARASTGLVDRLVSGATSAERYADVGPSPIGGRAVITALVGSEPHGLVVATRADVGRSRCRLTATAISPDGAPTELYSVESDRSAQLRLCADRAGSLILLTGRASHAAVLAPRGEVTTWQPGLRGVIASAIAPGGPGGWFPVADQARDAILRLGPRSCETWVQLPGGSWPASLAVDSRGVLYAANVGDGTVSRITPDGAECRVRLPDARTAAGSPVTAAPTKVVVDDADRVLVSSDSRILHVVWSASGAAETRELARLAGVAAWCLDPSRAGRVLILDDEGILHRFDV